MGSLPISKQLRAFSIFTNTLMLWFIQRINLWNPYCTRCS